MKTLLVLGSGGREHAIAWKLARDASSLKKLILAPGNDGSMASMEAFAKRFRSDLRIERWPFSLSEGKRGMEEFALRAREEGVGMVVVGADDPLAAGVVDVLEAQGVPAFGPCAAAARIEASKGFAKEVMQAAGVPTARYREFTELSQALEFVQSQPWGGPAVVKADGLALGKGVVVCSGVAEAQEACKTLMEISGKLVIEERVSGVEVSWFAICDGKTCALLEPAKDHKRLQDGDRGPNTGGMGAFSPPDVGADEEFGERVRNEVFLPTLQELAQRGAEFKGVLYAGLMVDPKSDRYWVLEFNSRFGDPEAQILLPRWKGDLLPWLVNARGGSLSAERVPFEKTSAVVVVGASPGYPEAPKKGLDIEGDLLKFDAQGVPHFFIAGVTRDSDRFKTSGGRVLGALGVGTRRENAARSAYQNLSDLRWEGMQFRRDIGGLP